MNVDVSVSSVEIAEFIHKKYSGGNISIEKAVPLKNLRDYSFSFAKKYSDENVALINENRNSLVIVCREYEGKLLSNHIISDNPRLDFLRVVRRYFYKARFVEDLRSSSFIDKEADIGKDVKIGYRCYIGSGVCIGEGTNIHHNVVITGDVSIGKNCIIKSGAIIGEEGFGFEYNEKGVPEHFPHIGRIVIGNNVFIGSNSTIELATIDATVMDDNVKIDDLVQIGHNCHVGENTMIMASVILCGGVTIGKNCWIAPKTVIREKLTVSDSVMTGLGAVIIRDVEPGMIVAGNPAKILRKRVER